jgi:hypothetical protein
MYNLSERIAYYENVISYLDTRLKQARRRLKALKIEEAETRPQRKKGR